MCLGHREYLLRQGSGVQETGATPAEKYLRPAIERAKQETGSDKVHIVAHSTGGLPARYYFQNVQQQGSGGDIAKLAMAGTPHLGVVNAYYIWAGGNPLRADELTGGARGGRILLELD